MKIINKSINRFFGKILSNDVLFEKLIQLNRKKLLNLINEYPSFINNGFRHIDRVIELVSYFQLDKKNAILDIGAAEGITALKFSNAFPNACIYAFEPMEETFNKLLKNTSKYPGICPIQKALGNKIIKMEIHKAHRITSSSLMSINTKIENEYFAEQLQYSGDELVTVNTLDDEFSNEFSVNIMKIDVQGFEMKVLQGANKILKKTFMIVIEMQNHDFYKNVPSAFRLDEYLSSLGFDLFDIIPSIRKNEKLYEWDAIYLNKNLL